MERLGATRVQWGGSIVGRNGLPTFVEVYAPGHFVRGHGDSVLEAAHEAMAKLRRRLSCEHGDWKYTHENGYKTCGKCGYLAPCTVEEALKNYQRGEVFDPELETHLKFDFGKSYCPCGRGHIIVHDPIFHSYRCMACQQILELVLSETGIPLRKDGDWVLRPAATLPTVVGLWLVKEQKWLYEQRGRRYVPLTIPISRLKLESYLRASQINKPGVEVRVFLPDGKPGDLIPVKANEEEFQEALCRVLTNLGNKTHRRSRINDN